MLEIKVECGSGALRGGQRVDHDHAGTPLDERHIGDVEASDLVDAANDLE